MESQPRVEPLAKAIGSEIGHRQVFNTGRDGGLILTPAIIEVAMADEETVPSSVARSTPARRPGDAGIPQG